MEFRDAGTRCLWRIGILELSRHLFGKKGRFVLEFHGIFSHRSSKLPADAQPGLSAEELSTILKWVGGRFRFLTPEEFLKGSAPGVLLTFDDGLASTFKCGVPILERYKAPAIFFVSTQHVPQPADWLPANRKLADQYWPKGEFDEHTYELFNGMDEKQLAKAGAHSLITVGCHTVSHPFLTQCDLSQLKYEIEASRQYLEDISGQRVDYFAYPTGDYDRSVAEAVMSAGYRAAFAELSKNIGLPAYEIPRVGIYRSETAYLAAKLSGLHQKPVSTIYD